jgi:hypothetical protein
VETYTALGIAAMKGYTDIIAMLVKAGANVNHPDKVGEVRSGSARRARGFLLTVVVTDVDCSSLMLEL